MAGNIHRVVGILKQADFGKVQEPEYAAVILFSLCRSAVMYKLLSGHARPVSLKSKRIVEIFLHGVHGK